MSSPKIYSFVGEYASIGVTSDEVKESRQMYSVTSRQVMYSSNIVKINTKQTFAVDSTFPKQCKCSLCFALNGATPCFPGEFVFTYRINLNLLKSITKCATIY